ncbi:DMT family transporter [Paenibacillus eucommiae]|uniref:Membrane protein n=1 Tax=Paenibacillus eucommiae TaxID=1355755 RepID=A0ABS4IRM8_9BACL|nr:DMT family transporter [Paenibacillus eucommiae]MBP1989671.1 putative membrane protein [Paenibacillus eucommiae]
MSETLVWLLVIASAVTHAIWNFYTKKSVHKSSFLWSIQTIASLVFMPFFISDVLAAKIGVQEIILLIITFVFQGMYVTLLSKAYQIGEISQVYPFMRGSAALLIPVISIFLYDEKLTTLGWAGLILIVSGLFGLSEIFSVRVNRKLLQTFLITFGVGLSITGYTIVDKSILDFMSPLGLLQIYNIAGFIFLSRPALCSGKLKQEWKVNWRTIMIGAAMAPGSYLLFLIAMKYAPLSHISPIREFSIVIGCFLGFVVLKEKQALIRIVYALVITTGITLISFWG